jgi:hypothetical protein
VLSLDTYCKKLISRPYKKDLEALRQEDFRLDVVALEDRVMKNPLEAGASRQVVLNFVLLWSLCPCSKSVLSPKGYSTFDPLLLSRAGRSILRAALVSSHVSAARYIARFLLAAFRSCRYLRGCSSQIAVSLERSRVFNSGCFRSLLRSRPKLLNFHTLRKSLSTHQTLEKAPLKQ